MSEEPVPEEAPVEELSRDSELGQEALKYGTLASLGYSDNRTRIKYADSLGYIYDAQLSSPKTAVFVDKERREVVMVNRGTDFSDKEDVEGAALTAIDAQKYSKRFKRAERDFSTITTKYRPGQWDIVLAGHSQGGTINLGLNAKYREYITEVFNYNPGASPIRGTRRVDESGDEYPPHVNNYYIADDVLSMFERQSKDKETRHFLMPKSASNAHTIKNFLLPKPKQVRKRKHD